MSILLITATIDSGYFGNISTIIKETEVRKKQYEETLTKYICNSKFDKIVFADNSLQSLDESYFTEMAIKNEKNLEFLECPGDIDLMKSKGKSYGEAALIVDAFRNSKLMQDESSFYKVTGRVWVNNINSLINERKENCFIAHNFVEEVLTSFFKVSAETFHGVLSSAPELCNDNMHDPPGHIEHVYYELLKQASEPIKCFNRYPDLRGINSGAGTLYDKTTKQRIVRSAAVFLGIMKFNPGNHFYYPLMRRISKVTALRAYKRFYYGG